MSVQPFIFSTMRGIFLKFFGDRVLGVSIFY